MTLDVVLKNDLRQAAMSMYNKLFAGDIFLVYLMQLSYVQHLISKAHFYRKCFLWVVLEWPSFTRLLSTKNDFSNLLQYNKLHTIYIANKITKKVVRKRY